MEGQLLLAGKTQEEIMGFASANRDILHGWDRKLFNSIIHCLDKDPHYYGNNIFAGVWDNNKLDTVRNILEDKIIKYKLQDKINKHPLNVEMIPVIMDILDKEKKINNYKDILDQDIDSVIKENIKLKKRNYIYENIYDIFYDKGWLRPENNAVIGNEVTEESIKQQYHIISTVNAMLDNDEPFGNEMVVNMMLTMMGSQIPTYDEYKDLKDKNKKYHKMLEIHFKGK
mgnify:CR=1 FL=1